MAYNAYVTRIKNLRQHSNADRLQCGTVFGSNVIVGLNTQEDELGIYFPVDGRLSVEYATDNNLLRKKDEHGNNIGGYLDPDKRNIKAVKLRGEKSDGLFMSLTSLANYVDITTLQEGDTITVLGGIKICEKYIPRRKNRTYNDGQTKRRKKRKDRISFPLFTEHSDTNQLAYNLHQFHPGDTCVITLKMHGTSQRTSNTVKQTKRIIPAWVHRILQTIGFKRSPKQEWDYISGSRRVILRSMEGGYYGSNTFRQQHHERFLNKLQKGETAYYEVVGYVSNGQPIMSDCSNKKTNDKEFIKQYGDTTRFSYGCDDGKSEIYIYRMTMTNEDGYIVEYPWELVKLRCEQMDINHCPEYETFTFTTTEDLMERVEKYWEGLDPIGGTHIKEGVVVRIINRERFTAYKHKNWHFKVLEGIIKESAEAPDIEEAQDIVEEAS